MGKCIFVLLLTLVVTSLFAAQVNLPSPSEWSGPSDAPTAPGDTFNVSCTGSSNSDAPVISEWDKYVGPDESFTMTGIRFTQRTGSAAGSDTTVWLWADDSNGGTLWQCKIMKLDGDSTLIATVPSSAPFGMYLVWVENAQGVSNPVCLNRPSANWVGPLGNTVTPNTSGQRKRIFGKNLSHDHGTSTTYVYLKRSGSSSYESLTVYSVNPYAVEFTLPSNLAAGDHSVYLHTGHGGQYGWSGPLTITASTPYSRPTNSASVSPGGNDATNIQNAIDTVTGQGGGTVNLSSGTFTLTNIINVKAGVLLKGAGKTSTVVNFNPSSTLSHGVAITGSNSGLQDMTLRIQHEVIYGFVWEPNGTPALNNLLVKNCIFQRDFAVKDCSWGVAPSASHLEVTGCDFYLSLTASGADMWTHGNNLYGNSYWSGEGAIQMCDGTRWVCENNTAQTPNWPNSNGNRHYLDLIPDTAPDYQLDHTHWSKRFFSGGNNNHDCYFAGNTGSDVAVDTNKGEIFLFHGYASNGWYAQVSSVNGNTVNMRTDGTVFGRSDIVVDSCHPATSVSQYNFYGTTTDPDNNSYIVIVAGPGTGQYRLVTGHTNSNLTVGTAWRVPPTSDSVIAMMRFNTNVVLYNNTMNAFPAGYVLNNFAASQFTSLDVSSMECAIEGNTSRRTYMGMSMCGTYTSPSWWNLSFLNNFYDARNAGMAYTGWSASTDYVLGPQLLGNTYRTNTSTIVSGQIDMGGYLLGYFSGLPAKSVGLYEYNECSGSERGGDIGGGIGLYRKNSISLTDSTGVAGGTVGLVLLDDSPLLAGNTYTNAAKTYVNYGLTSASCSSDRAGNEDFHGNDNDTNTYWAGYGAPAWWVVDLQGAYTLTGSEVANRNNGTINSYYVDVSSDGTNWSQVIYRSGGSWTLSHDSFSASNIRYVRIRAVSTGWFCFSEFRVFSGGNNVALNQPPKDKLAVTYPTVILTGNIGDTLSETNDVDNFGFTNNCVWSVQSVSDNWLSISTSNTTVSPEQSNGQVTITANTSSLSAGTTWGSVTLASSSGKTVVIGVKVTLNGPPSLRASQVR